MNSFFLWADIILLQTSLTVFTIALQIAFNAQFLAARRQPSKPVDTYIQYIFSLHGSHRLYSVLCWRTLNSSKQTNNLSALYSQVLSRLFAWLTSIVRLYYPVRILVGTLENDLLATQASIRCATRSSSVNLLLQEQRFKPMGYCSVVLRAERRELQTAIDWCFISYPLVCSQEVVFRYSCLGYWSSNLVILQLCKSAEMVLNSALITHRITHNPGHWPLIFYGNICWFCWYSSLLEEHRDYYYGLQSSLQMQLWVLLIFIQKIMKIVHNST